MTEAQPIRPNPLGEDRNEGIGGLDGVDDQQVIDPELMIEQILADQNLTQHITRRFDEGTDTLVGYFRCHLQRQQQRYALHVPLYPPMNAVPEAEANVMDSTNASVKVTDRQRFGLRMEVVFPKPTVDEIDVLVEVIVCSDS